MTEGLNTIMVRLDGADQVFDSRRQVKIGRAGSHRGC
jgi:hypothetical protein